MVENCFSILFSNRYIRELIEREFLENHLEKIFWPEQVEAHKALLELIPNNQISRPTYLSSYSAEAFFSLQNLNITSVIVLSEYRPSKNLQPHDLLISGVNTSLACRRTADFIINQLQVDTASKCSLTILPNLGPDVQRSLR